MKAIKTSNAHIQTHTTTNKEVKSFESKSIANKHHRYTSFDNSPPFLITKIHIKKNKKFFSITKTNKLNKSNKYYNRYYNRTAGLLSISFSKIHNIKYIASSRLIENLFEIKNLEKPHMKLKVII